MMSDAAVARSARNGAKKDDRRSFCMVFGRFLGEKSRVCCRVFCNASSDCRGPAGAAPRRSAMLRHASAAGVVHGVDSPRTYRKCPKFLGGQHYLCLLVSHRTLATGFAGAARRARLSDCTVKVLTLISIGVAAALRVIHKFLHTTGRVTPLLLSCAARGARRNVK